MNCGDLEMDFDQRDRRDFLRVLTCRNDAADVGANGDEPRGKKTS